MNLSRVIRFLAGLTFFCLTARPGMAGNSPASQPFEARLQKVTKNFQKIDSKYYVIYTDLDELFIREAVARLTALFEEYRIRTKDFTSRPPGKAPVYFFGKDEDYLNAVPPDCAKTGGIYHEPCLLIRASRKDRDPTWVIMQHEGFHQFVRLAIKGDMPTWVNEGLAGYFEDGYWTGDTLVTGRVYSERLKNIKTMIQKDKLLPFDKMFAITREQWNADFREENYDQAWSMVHYLADGEAGRYRATFAAYIMDVSSHKDPTEAFAARFGTDTAALQRDYSAWWLAQDKPDPEFARFVAVRLLTNFLARAYVARLPLQSFEDFRSALRNGKLKRYLAENPALWLPDALLEQAREYSEKSAAWRLETGITKLPVLKLEFIDGTTFRGEFDPKTLKPTVRFTPKDPSIILD